MVLKMIGTRRDTKKNASGYFVKAINHKSVGEKVSLIPFRRFFLRTRKYITQVRRTIPQMMIEMDKNDNWERGFLLIAEVVLGKDVFAFVTEGLVDCDEPEDQDMFSITLAKKSETSASESGNVYRGHQPDFSSFSYNFKRGS